MPHGPSAATGWAARRRGGSGCGIFPLQIASDCGPVYEPRSLIRSEHRMRFSAAGPAGRVAAPLAALMVLAGVCAVTAAEGSFPYDSTLLLEARPMKGSKRVPILQIEPRGEASIDLWCNTVAAQLVVVDNTITVILGATTEKQCDPDRMQADQDLQAALQQVTTWRRQDDLLVLQGERTLRFHVSTN
jgi:heat shock protein HslJ